MKKPLNEQFIRMQKLAGIITENQINKEKSVTNEAKEFSFTFSYNTDEDDVAYIQKVLKKAGVNATAEAGLDSEEMEVKAGNAIELRKAKKAIEDDGFQINNENQINEDDIFKGQYSIGNEAYDRMDGLVNENDYDNFIRSATNIMNTLTSDGFEPKEVFYYLYTRLTVEV